MQQTGSPEALLAAIARSGNEVSQGWMRLLSRTAWMDALPRSGALQADYLEKQTRLWTSLLAGKREAIADPAPGDRRFAAREWRENPYYDYLRQSYLLAAHYFQELVDQAELEGEAKERARFAARQWLDAMCPANFAATNPEAMRQALETQAARA